MLNTDNEFDIFQNQFFETFIVKLIILAHFLIYEIHIGRKGQIILICFTLKPINSGIQAMLSFYMISLYLILKAPHIHTASPSDRPDKPNCHSSASYPLYPYMRR
jgi:hypothetical protein